MAKKINKKADTANLKALFVCLFGLPLVIGYGLYVMLCKAKASQSKGVKTLPLPTAQTHDAPVSARVTEVYLNDRWVSIVATPVIPTVEVAAAQPMLLTYERPTLLLTYVPQAKDESVVLVPDRKTVRLKKVRELLAKGLTKTAAAKELKVSPTTLRRWLQAA